MSSAPTFQPSGAQRRLLDYIHEHPSYHTIGELCAAASIGRTTYYRWCQDPAFRLWLTTAWSARLLMDGVVLINIARLGATRSFSYWKALADLTFDPKGLALLANWQQNAAQAQNTAFEPPEETPPAPEPPSPIPPTPVPPLSPSNQPLAPKNGTSRPPLVRPHHAARSLGRPLARAARAFARPGKSAPAATAAPFGASGPRKQNRGATLRRPRSVGSSLPPA